MNGIEETLVSILKNSERKSIKMISEEAEDLLNFYSKKRKKSSFEIETILACYNIVMKNNELQNEASKLADIYIIDKKELDNELFLIESYAEASLYEAVKPFVRNNDYYEKITQLSKKTSKEQNSKLNIILNAKETFEEISSNYRIT